MADKVLTWEEKEAKGIPLNFLDQVKADATRITLRRIREQQEDAQYQESKGEPTPAGLPLPATPKVEAPAEPEEQKGTPPENSKKGN